MTQPPDQPPASLADVLDDLEFIAHARGCKSSDGDGRTAADIRAELAAAETDDGAH